MPIHDVGYRPWQGSRLPVALRWWVIAQTGVRLAWRSQWLRRMLFVAWLPAVGFGFLFFIYERGMTDPEARVAATAMLSRLPQSKPIISKASLSPESARREVWALTLLTFFRIPQGMLMVLLVGLVAPPLVATDLRTRAYLLYFSRPIERVDYLVGKSAVVWTYLTLVTTVPALALYALGVGLSPSIDVVWYTWDLPLRVLAASVFLIVPTTALALCFSSMTSETRYAAYAWFSMWVMGWIAYWTLSSIDLNKLGGTPNLDALDSRWELVSLYHTLGRVQSWVFGLEPEYHKVLPALVLLTAITLSSLLVFSRRITAPLRI